MVGRVLRRALVGLFGAPHCGNCDIHLNCPIPRCRLSKSERKRVLITVKIWLSGAPEHADFAAIGQEIGPMEILYTEEPSALTSASATGVNDRCPGRATAFGR